MLASFGFIYYVISIIIYIYMLLWFSRTNEPKLEDNVTGQNRNGNNVNIRNTKTKFMFRKSRRGMLV